MFENCRGTLVFDFAKNDDDDIMTNDGFTKEKKNT